MEVNCGSPSTDVPGITVCSAFLRLLSVLLQSRRPALLSTVHPTTPVKRACWQPIFQLPNVSHAPRAQCASSVPVLNSPEWRD